MEFHWVTVARGIVFVDDNYEVCTANPCTYSLSPKYSAELPSFTRLSAFCTNYFHPNNIGCFFDGIVVFMNSLTSTTLGCVADDVSSTVPPMRQVERFPSASHPYFQASTPAIVVNFYHVDWCLQSASIIYKYVLTLCRVTPYASSVFPALFGLPTPSSIPDRSV